ncbi:MAG TPA: MotA/TolQ/ExbB proton channel family protein [Nitrospiria bacterium]|nr:MotA/TolQ/ExbB proton channel family protein [Nitrospiria bacterium]
MSSQVISLILGASPVTKVVLVILLGLSVISWAVIFYKWNVFRQSSRQNRQFIGLFSLADGEAVRRAAERHSTSPMAIVWIEATKPPPTVEPGHDDLHALEVRFRRSIEMEVSRHEEYLPFLATTGNVAPFIGLFGTVLGIIDSFQSISRMGTASIAAVAPGIAEALVATAAGLFAAIPAVVAYNYYLSRLRRLNTHLESFAAEAVERLTRPARAGAAKG